MCDVPVHQSISEPESQLLLSSISTHYLEMKVKDFANFYIVHWFTNSFFGHKNDVDHYRCANNIIIHLVIPLENLENCFSEICTFSRHYICN